MTVIIVMAILMVLMAIAFCKIYFMWSDTYLRAAVKPYVILGDVVRVQEKRKAVFL